jgi:hypothetical protein
MTDDRGIWSASAPSVGALVFLGRPHLRACLTLNTVADGGSGGATSIATGVVSSASRNAVGRPILASKACSTRLASSAEKRFLAFRMAIARGCSSSFDKVSICRVSCAANAAESRHRAFPELEV